MFRNRENHTLSNLSWSLRDVKAYTNPEVCSDIVWIRKRHTYFARIARRRLLMIQKSQCPISVQVTKANVGAVSRAHPRGAPPFLCFEELNPGSDVQHGDLARLASG